MARIATITTEPSSASGGTSRHLGYLEEALRLEGHEVEGYTMAMARLDRPWSLLDRLGFRLIANSAILAAQVSKARPCYDLIFANGFLGAFLPSDLKVVNVLHSCDAGQAHYLRRGLGFRDFLRRRFIWGGMEGWSAWRHYTVAVPRSVARQFRKYYGKTPDTAIPNCVDTGRFAPGDKRRTCLALGLDPELSFVLFVGAWQYGKGVHIINSLAGSLPSNIKILAAGKRLPDGPAMDPRIQHFPHVAAEQMPELYRCADLFVLPSLAEGLEYVSLEAMACGVPVLISDAGVGSHLLSHPELGEFVVSRGADYLSYYQRVTRILDNRELQLRLGEQGRQLALSEFGVQEFQRAYQALVRRMLDGVHE